MTPTQIELHNAHKARLQRIAQAAARVNPKTDSEFSAALNAVDEPAVEPKPEPAKPEQSHDQWAREQIKRNTKAWSEVVSGLTETSEGQPTIKAIQLAACDVFGVKLNDLLSSRRTADVTMPRHVSMYLAKEMTGLSYPQISQIKSLIEARP